MHQLGGMRLERLERRRRLMEIYFFTILGKALGQ